MLYMVCVTKFCLFFSYDEGSDLQSCALKEVGSFCDSDEDCTASMNNTICASTDTNPNDTCICEVGYYVIGTNICEPGDEIGDPCEATEDCVAMIEGSVCVQGFCECVPEYIVNPFNTCSFRLYPGDNCTNDTECTLTVPLTECFENTCHCLEGFRFDTNSMTCNETELYDPCEIDRECGSYAEHIVCPNVVSICLCDDGWRNVSETECVMNELGDPCGSDTDCAGIVGAECDASSGGLCACGPEYTTTASGVACLCEYTSKQLIVEIRSHEIGC